MLYPSLAFRGFLDNVDAYYVVHFLTKERKVTDYMSEGELLKTAKPFFQNFWNNGDAVLETNGLAAMKHSSLKAKEMGTKFIAKHFREDLLVQQDTLCLSSGKLKNV